MTIPPDFAKATEKKRALLVSVYKGQAEKETCFEHLDELALLCDTFGLEVVDKIPCGVRKFDASTFVTEGKLQELQQAARDCRADFIVFDDEVAPSQQRNLEKAFQLPVFDRTAVILSVFAQRAHTKEARLQIELAEVKYLAPRLKRLWSHLSRQHGTGGSGGGAYLKGEGEKQIEIDRRILKRKIDQLQKEIAEVKHYRETQRIARARSEIPVFAIIGYTNAGKSTLLNALTEANVFVEDKLFATLDTTTRKFNLPNNQDVLLIDTVGFIRKLPHLLVAAFKSTLEEAFQADFLIHLIDASHPAVIEQAETSIQLLKELGVEDKPMITVLNKCDRAIDPDKLHKLSHLFPHTVRISALFKTGFEEFSEEMVQMVSRKRKAVLLRIPQKDYAIVSELVRLGHVLNLDYEDNDVCLKVDIPVSLIGRFSKYIIHS